MRRTIIPALLAFFLLAGAALAQGTPAIPWSVLGGGGGHAEAAPYAMDGTLGQPIVGQAASLPYDLCAGFWCGAPPYRIYLPLLLKNS
jgi:hypothetical protein